MSRYRSAGMVAAALLCLLPRVGSAQEPGANPELLAALQAVRPGNLVRLSVNGVRDTGRVAVASSNLFAFRYRYPDTVPASSIDSLWVYKSNAGRGALIGAGVMGTASALFGLAMSGMALDYEPSGADQLKGAAAFGIAGGLIGGLLGGTIGSMLSHWTLVSPRR